MEEPFICWIIDDDIDDQLITEFAMIKALPGALCFSVSSCKQAVELFTSGDLPAPDLIFSDWNMPPFSAEENLSLLRGPDQLKATDLYVLSGVSPAISAELQAKLAIKGLLVKYSSIEELATLLASVIGAEQ